MSDNIFDVDNILATQSGFYDDAPMPGDDEDACCHCGERVRVDDERGECAHGICHAQCLIDAGCVIA